MLNRGRVNKKFSVIAVLAVVVIAGGLFIVSRNNSGQVAGTQTSNRVTSLESNNAKATAEVYKSFDFEAINQNQDQKDIKFTISTVERKDQIMVQGEVKTAPKGSDYLLVRLEIENSHSERLAMTPSDLIRLDDAGKLFAPDYHNGNVILDPISTKKDLVSFVVKSDAKKFAFQVGELNGDKQKVEISY